MHPRSNNHPMALTCWFTKQPNSTFMVSTIINLKLVDIHGISFPHGFLAINVLLPSITFCACIVFLVCLIFIAHFIVGLTGVYVNCGIFFQTLLYVFTLFSNNSLISQCISAKLVSTSPMYPLPVILFSA